MIYREYTFTCDSTYRNTAQQSDFEEHVTTSSTSVPFRFSLGMPLNQCLLWIQNVLRMSLEHLWRRLQKVSLDKRCFQKIGNIYPNLNSTVQFFKELYIKTITSATKKQNLKKKKCSSIILCPVCKMEFISSKLLCYLSEVFLQPFIT